MHHIKLLTLITLIITSCGLSHPPFDPGKPDTKNNQFHYKNLLRVDVTPDVKNLYTYGSEIGFDATYYVAFECSAETAQKIIEANQMVEDDKKGLSLSRSFDMPWWKKEEIKSLARYKYQNEKNTYFKYFWYNWANKHAYFLDFDL